MQIQEKFNILFTRKGTCHSERLLPELIDNHLLINDKQFSDHLRFLYLYTDLLAYYDSNNQRMDGNIWRKFLERDETVMRSLILHTNVNEFKKSVHKDFLALRRNQKGAEDQQHIEAILAIAQELITLLNYWYKNLASEDVIRIKLATIIHEELNLHLSKVYKVLHQHYKEHLTQSVATFCSFIEQQWNSVSLWKSRDDLIYSDLERTSLHQEEVIDVLDDFFDAALHTIYQLKELAATDYFDTLYTQQKEPHMALLIAFLQLLQYADDHLNHIPQRFLDHYYRHVLKFNNNPSIPDNAYVHFTLNPNYAFALVPAGSRLIAKNPFNGEEILFEVQRNIIVNRAKIDRIHVLTAKQKASKEKHKTIVVTAATFNNEMLTKLPYPMFPLPQNSQAIQVQSPLVMLIGSPLFYLSEGVRTIHIKWKFTSASFQALIDKKEDKAISTASFLAQLAGIFHTTSYVQVTTKTGWFTLSEETITIEFIAEEGCLHMTLALGTEIPSLDRLPTDCHCKKMVDPGVPALSIGIDNLSSHGFHLLNGLIVEKINLKVGVKQYRGLILQNQLGLIDNSQIIEPFGPLAKPDSSFYIGSGEIFSKNLTALSLNIQWDNVPTTEGGFKRYYKGYPTQVNNEDFKVSISYLNHQHWNPFYQQNRECVPLFQFIKGNKGSERVDPYRTIQGINIHALDITTSNEPLEVAFYTPHTIAGFLKLKLNVPEQAFGHAVYPSLMSHVLVKNAHKKKEEKDTVLNEPYTPRIKSITADYEAEEMIVLTSPTGEQEAKYNNCFFHISSFGYVQLFPNAWTTPITLFPWTQEEEAFIAFGIKDLNGDNLSMHVAIDENNAFVDQWKIPQLSWFYLFDNVWFPLEEAIMLDGTNGCTQSGIIIFDLNNLPNKINGHNTYMDPDLIWIKIQCTGGIDTLVPIVGVYLQAVTVSRVMDKQGVFAAPVLPPKTIEQLQHAIEGIEEVRQPFKTFGGRQFENHQAFYRRVSERLRHKNRAISVWDYERMVLEKFPEIFRVKCINHAVKNRQSMVQPGCITLVVVAKEGRGSIHTLPIVSKQLLHEIQLYIQSISAPFIQFEVTNPTYEDVKVNVTVKFKIGYEKGLFLNILQQALRNFISPWLFDASADIQIGGEIPTSKVIDFINSLYYIEGIGNFSIFKYAGKTPNLKLDKVSNYDSHLWASYPWSVMVSSKNHKISAVDKFDATLKLRHGCIGDMAIGEDFIIGPLELPAGTEPITCKDEDIPNPSLEEYCLITPKHIRTNHVNY